MSKLVNKSRLQHFATKLWEKIKERYDVAFKNATISPSEGNEKNITFERISGQTPLKVSLEDYARLQDRNAFKKDVSVNDAANINNTHIGTVNGAMSRNRVLAYRGLTSKSFIDGYVHSIIVYIDGSVQNDAASTWKVWAVNKKQDKNSDTINTLLHTNYRGVVETLNINGTDRKIVRIPVDRTFNEEVYFLLRTATQDIQAMTRIGSQYIEDVINVPHDQSSVPNTNVNYADNATNNTITMHLVGRESIKSLSEKLDKVSSDSSTYVKHSECTVEGGQVSHAGKVVKLDDSGKLNKNMLPSIAINEYIQIAEFTNAGLRDKRYENGDVVVVTTNGQVSKRYLCINKRDGVDNSIEDFVELNSKDGVVTSLNGKRGDLSLALESTETHVKLKVNGDGEAAETQLEIITTDEIDAMITALPTT